MYTCSVILRLAADLQSWASREGLSEKTVEVLIEQAFTSLDDLELLSPEDVTECFQKPQLLPIRQCLALKKAIAKLSSGESTPAPLSPSGPSATSPPGKPLPAAAPQSPHGRDQSDFGSSGFEALSLSESEGTF